MFNEINENDLTENYLNEINSNIDEFGFNSCNIVKIKTLKIEIEIKDQDNNYELVFNDQGVFLEKRHELFGIKKICDGNYQMGKIIEFENGETKKKFLAIIIRNTDTKSEILFSCIDLIKDTKINYIYPSEIPPIKDFTFHILDKNDEKQLIIFLSCEKKIYVIKFVFNNSGNIELNNKNNIFELCNKVKLEYSFKKFKPISICPIRIFKRDDQIFEKNKVFSNYFLVSSQTNIKLFKYNKEEEIIFVSNVEFENEEYNILAEGKHISRIEQLDNGLIAIHINKKIISGYLFLDE